MSQKLLLSLMIAFSASIPSYAQINLDNVLKSLKSKGFEIDSTNRANSFIVTEPTSMYDDTPITVNLVFSETRNIKRIWIFCLVQRLSKVESTGSMPLQLLKANGGLACARFAVFEGDTSDAVYLVENIEQSCFDANVIPQVIACMRNEVEDFVHSLKDGLAPTSTKRKEEGTVLPEEPKDSRARRR